MTLDEFLRLPEAEPALEYFRGEVIQKVSPKIPHGLLQIRLGGHLDHYASPRRLAHILSETRVSFGGASVVPDLIAVRWDRLPLDANGRVEDELRVAPDLAIEILLPGQTVREPRSRCQWYVDNGVTVALLIHPGREWIQAFRPDQIPRLFQGDDIIDVGPVLPGLTWRAGDLFAALRPAR